MEKKIKLPRKRKKLYKKESGPDADLNYMSAVIVNEFLVEEGDFSSRKVNPRKFHRKIETYGNGQIKRVISYY